MEQINTQDSQQPNCARAYLHFSSPFSFLCLQLSISGGRSQVNLQSIPHPFYCLCPRLTCGPSRQLWLNVRSHQYFPERHRGPVTAANIDSPSILDVTPCPAKVNGAVSDVLKNSKQTEKMSNSYELFKYYTDPSSLPEES